MDSQGVPGGQRLRPVLRVKDGEGDVACGGRLVTVPPTRSHVLPDPQGAHAAPDQLGFVAPPPTAVSRTGDPAVRGPGAEQPRAAALLVSSGDLDRTAASRRTCTCWTPRTSGAQLHELSQRAHRAGRPAPHGHPARGQGQRGVRGR
ncbi:hypothetical protein QJS66_19000 [Kocuria rhizophila]|nr:hypothetical protein QJS66_19000 [Kocuria rhizophila]